MTTAKPILFSDPMVRALIEGRKTQTRRVLKPQPPPECSIHYMLGNESWLPDNKRTPLRHHWEAWFGDLYQNRPARHLCGSLDVRMPWAPGDFLWVREPWRTEARFDDLPPREIPQSALVSFEADYDDEPNDGCRGRLRPGMFMPRWASRFTLEVTAVKVERLQETSDVDAAAEGMQRPFVTLDRQDWPAFMSPVDAFAHLWNSLNAKRGFGWEANPWVGVYSFRVHRVNVDDLLRNREAA